jgi:hypothetical protein
VPFFAVHRRRVAAPAVQPPHLPCAPATTTRPTRSSSRCLTGSKNIAVFYQDDAYGEAGLKGVEARDTKRNLKIWPGTVGAIPSNKEAVGRSEAAPDAVVMIEAPPHPCASHPPDERPAARPVLQRFVRRQHRSPARSRGRRWRHLAGARFPGLSIPVVKVPGNVGEGRQQGLTTAILPRQVFVEGRKRTGKNLTRGAHQRRREDAGRRSGGFFVTYSPKATRARSCRPTIIAHQGKFCDKGNTMAFALTLSSRRAAAPGRPRRRRRARPQREHRRKLQILIAR